MFKSYRPKHVLTICRSGTGEVACRLDICYALCDAYSLSILLRDVVNVYKSRIPPAPRPFSDVVRYIKGRPKSETVGYWTSFLQGAKPCQFPIPLPHSPLDPKFQEVHDSISFPVESLASVTGFCRRNGLTRSVFVHIAWALVLSHFTRLDEVYFGYMASGRDAPVKGIDRIFGPLANMLTSRINLDNPLKALVNSIATFLKEHRLHQ
ncbi:condensation domain-containing protein [Hirsutella rhossiliensis]